MYKFYYVNNVQTFIPGLHHEVHTKEHTLYFCFRSQSILQFLALPPVWYTTLHHKPSLPAPIYLYKPSISI